MNQILQKILKQALSKKEEKRVVAKKPDEDFIPYVCHYDPNTILTKNGELLQVIRITGFSNNSVMSELISLRDAVRDSIKNHIKETNFAIWFNTIRRKKNIVPKGEFLDYFSNKINQKWVSDNEWNDQYVNELYITIIIEGIDSSITNFKSFLKSFSYSNIKSLHNSFLEDSHKRLSRVVKHILEDTKDYGAKLLGLKEWDGVIHSEPMRFFGKIANLYEENYPLSFNDISNDLSSHKIAFGGREIEVLGEKNNNFAAILSMKEYFEVTTETLDQVLQLPFEFIITQSFDFSFEKKDLENHEYQDAILKISEDEEMRELMGMKNFIESSNNSNTDYGKMQTTIMIISHDREKLEESIKLAIEQFNLIGFVFVREDVFLEHCFWSQLPANFCYLYRQKIINTYRIGGFAALHNFPAGLIIGNHWDYAVSVFKTILNTPYFFNFHEYDLGHTMFLGTNDSYIGLLNFLLSQSTKFKPRIFYFDFNNLGKSLIQAIEGNYYEMKKSRFKHESFLNLNPLSLENNPENKKFLEDFFKSLVMFSKNQLSDDDLELIPRVVDKIFVSNVKDFNIAIEYFNNLDTINIYNRLKVWNGENLNHIFSSQSEIDWNGNIIGFDLTEIQEHKPILIPVLFYILYRLELILEKQEKTIFVFKDAWELFDNNIFSEKIKSFLKNLKEKNAIAILTSKDPKKVSESKIYKEIIDNIATQIFMPSKETEKYNKDVLMISDDEIEIIKAMEENEGHFLLKHSDDSVIACFKSSSFLEEKILSPDETSITVVDEVISNLKSENNEKPKTEEWLAEFLAVMEEMKKEEEENAKQKAKQEAIEKRKNRDLDF